ncbi:MAG: hypothetical protein GAK28_00121 [Luteibacter sp.]|uniref:hypothetical protein n=1 Tax=Luteibacter sp. TaxID=1886636 RepID=UPI00137EFA75|nr:hypothetical protein [Luteibacter sp.]KAF1009483.1 MAG: hypothetical protein GAK28_00121 [Luteibacter sp.]
MPANNFSIGKDISVVFVTPTGTLNLPVSVTSFEAKPIYNKIRSTHLDKTRGANTPQGWDGSLQLDRFSSVVDDFFAQQEAGYYAGLNTLTGSITETIQEANGSISQYRYTDVVFSFEEAGKYTGDQKVTQTIGFFASQKLKVA